MHSERPSDGCPDTVANLKQLGALLYRLRETVKSNGRLSSEDKREFLGMVSKGTKLVADLLQTKLPF